MSLIAEFIAAYGSAEKLLAEHVDDGTGHCRNCSAGPQAGRMTWPCSLHAHAREAADLAEAGR